MRAVTHLDRLEAESIHIMRDTPGQASRTIANVVERKLAARGRHTFLLDGDNVRHEPNRDLGFKGANPIENCGAWARSLN